MLFICFQVLPRSSGDNCQISKCVSIFHEVLFFLCTLRSWAISPRTVPAVPQPHVLPHHPLGPMPGLCRLGCALHRYWIHPGHAMEKKKKFHLTSSQLNALELLKLRLLYKYSSVVHGGWLPTFQLVLCAQLDWDVRRWLCVSSYCSGLDACH